jgi:hypothetical protein
MKFGIQGALDLVQGIHKPREIHLQGLYLKEMVAPLGGLYGQHLTGGSCRPRNKAISTGSLLLSNRETKQQLSMMSTYLYQIIATKVLGDTYLLWSFSKVELWKLDTYQPGDILLCLTQREIQHPNGGAPRRGPYELLRCHPLSEYVHHERRTFEQCGSVEPPRRAVEWYDI